VSTNHKESNEVAADVICSIESLALSSGVNPELVYSQRDKYIGQSNVVKIARVIGLALRHNIGLLQIIESLDKYDIEFSSFVFHLKKLLMKFVKNGVAASDSTCPSCNSKNSIIYQDGCKMCTQCNWGAC
jgi:hypothetical protein